MARFHVRVQPGARTTKWAGWFGELPKLAVKAPPVDGAANQVVVAEVAKLFGVATRSVRLVGGAAARTKRLEIDGLDPDQLATIVASRLGAPASR